MRHFNTAGPCRADLHYMIPAAQRVVGVRRLVEQQAYFVLHAPRQSGKTTAMMEVAHDLNDAGRFASLVVSAEVGAAFADDPGTAERAILESWRLSARAFLRPEDRPPEWPDAPEGSRILAALESWRRAIARPLALFIDEIDALADEALISVLRQLRAGYPTRPYGFPECVALIGLRDVRDDKVASGGSGRLSTSSPFNIKVESLTLAMFTLDEVAALYGQHRTDTGQEFTPDAVEQAYDDSQGQPWLVNALARQAVEVVVPDRSQAVTRAAMRQAREIIIERQDTHLDSLADRLREPRIRSVIEPIMAGTGIGDVPPDDVRFVLDLGLCRYDEAGRLVIANPIYREVLPRTLTAVTQASLPPITPVWLRPDGALDPQALLDAFVAFWRRHGQPLLAGAHYTEIAPHIVMMAFLHRVCNGGGTLEREYAVGTGRMDMLLRYGSATIGMELKVWRDGEPDPAREGLTQLDAYLAGMPDADGWLVLFDRRSGIPPIAERTATENALTPSGRSVTVVRA